MIAEILAGLAAILDWQVLGFLAVGVSLGAVFGSLPGLTATMGVAVLTPLTFWVSAEQGLAMLLGIYCGAIPAGGIPAILINVPGTPASIATTWDGYALTRKGSAGLALGVNAIASAVGQLTSIMFLAFLAFPIARFALQFGPAEYFGLALLGISLMAGVSGRHVIKGMLAGMLGLALALVGLDPMTAYPRYTFGMSEFLDGISFVPVMIGLFGLGEVLIQISERHKARKSASAEIGRILPSAGGEDHGRRDVQRRHGRNDGRRDSRGRRGHRLGDCLGTGPQGVEGQGLVRQGVAPRTGCQLLCMQCGDRRRDDNDAHVGHSRRCGVGDPDRHPRNSGQRGHAA